MLRPEALMNYGASNSGRGLTRSVARFRLVPAAATTPSLWQRGWSQLAAPLPLQHPFIRSPGWSTCSMRHGGFVSEPSRHGAPPPRVVPTTSPPPGFRGLEPRAFASTCGDPERS